MWTPKSMTFSLGFGIVLIILGIVIIITRLNEVVMNHVLNTNLPLRDGSKSYDLWKTANVEFRVYLFDVTNPEEIQKSSDQAILIERGPYVYDVLVEKNVIAVNESADTVEHTTKRTYFFNAMKSGNLSEHDEVTVLNTAYIGTIITIADMAASMLPTVGANIPLLFTDPESIFLRTSVKNILFDGLPLTCDDDTYPQLGMICMVLQGQRPPIVRALPEKGAYLFSYFYNMNGTNTGPFTISRGVKDRFTTGLLSEYKGSHYANVWAEDDCSVVKGTDALFYPPMRSRGKGIFTYIPEFCSAILVGYQSDKMYSGIIGYHYRTAMSMWDELKPSCYCPRNESGDVVCLLQGALDLTKCQESPVMMTEPHFLHGNPGLFSVIKQGIYPEEDKHASYVVVDPITGTPLSGSKKMQLNMMLQPQPLDLLGNVSEGLFPLLWVDEGSTPGLKLLEPIILLHRFKRLLEFFVWIPFIVGIFFVVHSFWINMLPETVSETSGRVTISASKDTLN